MDLFRAMFRLYEPNIFLLVGQSLNFFLRWVILLKEESAISWGQVHALVTLKDQIVKSKRYTRTFPCDLARWQNIS